MMRGGPNRGRQKVPMKSICQWPSKNLQHKRLEAQLVAIKYKYDN